MSQATITANHQVIQLAGKLDYDNVMSLYFQGVRLIAATPHRSVEVDFKQVTEANSAAIALIVEWLKFSRQQDKKITLINLSPSLQLIAAAAGMEKLLS